MSAILCRLPCDHSHSFLLNIFHVTKRLIITFFRKRQTEQGFIENIRNLEHLKIDTVLFVSLSTFLVVDYEIHMQNVKLDILRIYQGERGDLGAERKV